MSNMPLGALYHSSVGVGPPFSLLLPCLGRLGGGGGGSVILRDEERDKMRKERRVIALPQLSQA